MDLWKNNIQIKTRYTQQYGKRPHIFINGLISGQPGISRANKHLTTPIAPSGDAIKHI